MADTSVAFEDRDDKSLLIVDDDRPFSTRLARAMDPEAIRSGSPRAWRRACRPSRAWHRPSR